MQLCFLTSVVLSFGWFLWWMQSVFLFVSLRLMIKHFIVSFQSNTNAIILVCKYSIIKKLATFSHSADLLCLSLLFALSDLNLKSKATFNNNDNKYLLRLIYLDLEISERNHASMKSQASNIVSKQLCSPLVVVVVDVKVLNESVLILVHVHLNV